MEEWEVWRLWELCQRRFEELMGERRRWRDERQKLEGVLAEVRQQLEQLQQQLTEKERLVEDLQKQLKEREKRAKEESQKAPLSKVSQQLTEKERLVQKLQLQLRQREEEVYYLRQQLQSLLQQMEHQIAELNGKGELVGALFKLYRQRSKLLNFELEEKTQLIKEKEEQLKEVTRQLTYREKLLKKREEQIFQLKGVLETLEELASRGETPLSPKNPIDEITRFLETISPNRSRPQQKPKGFLGLFSQKSPPTDGIKVVIVTGPDRREWFSSQLKIPKLPNLPIGVLSPSQRGYLIWSPGGITPVYREASEILERVAILLETPYLSSKVARVVLPAKLSEKPLLYWELPPEELEQPVIESELIDSFIVAMKDPSQEKTNNYSTETVKKLIEELWYMEKIPSQKLNFYSFNEQQENKPN